jgi:hypothetical protein
MLYTVESLQSIGLASRHGRSGTDLEADRIHASVAIEIGAARWASSGNRGRRKRKETKE